MLRKIDWEMFAADLVRELSAMPERERSLTLRLREILRRAGNPFEPKGFRTRAFWLRIGRGESREALKRAGLLVVLPGGKGQEVREVTFVLIESPNPANA